MLSLRSLPLLNPSSVGMPLAAQIKCGKQKWTFAEVSISARTAGRIARGARKARAANMFFDLHIGSHQINSDGLHTLKGERRGAYLSRVEKKRDDSCGDVDTSELCAG